MLVGKEAGVGNTANPGLCKQASACRAEAGPGFLRLQRVIPPYANFASTSWQVGS